MNFRELLLVATISMGTLLNPLNSAMIAVAIPRLQQAFSLSYTDISWLISSYYLASAIGQPVMGKISDTYGRKRLFMVGLVLVGAASGLAPWAPSLAWLIGFRMIQAVGSSTLSPAGMGIIREKIKTNLPQALGMVGVFAMTSAAFGPSVGGLLIGVGGWPAIFLVNFPIVIISAILATRVLEKDSQQVVGIGQLDAGGIVLFTVFALSWMWFLLSFANGIDWRMVPLGLGAAVTFYWWETRAAHPFIDLQALRQNMGANMVYLQFILVNIVFYSLFFGMPMYLQTQQHYSVAATGIVMLSLAGLGVVTTPFVAKLIHGRGVKPALYAGALFMTAGMLMLLCIGEPAEPVRVCAVLALLGVASAFNNLGLQTALYSYVRQEDTGAASGLFMMARYIGTILSSALLGLLFTHATEENVLTAIAAVGGITGGILMALTMGLPKAKEMENL